MSGVTSPAPLEKNHNIMGRSIQVMTLPHPRHPVPAFDLFNVLFEQIFDPVMTVVLSFDAQVDE
ncbi:hypothetical protein, partial [Methanocalculus sp.]|uniref:hypothetical protein n=1 Tax=Methanocalculus sp. TaxID=2004547 RepID=UPI00262B1E27